MSTAAELIGWVGAGLALGTVSAPHCMAMCGPVSAAACSGGANPVRSAAAYQAGRMLGYGAGGAALGTLGGAALATFKHPWAQAAVTWALAATLVVAGADLWRRARRADPARAVVPAERLLGGRGARSSWLPGVFGAATIFIPCGALWGALALAAGSQSAAGGAAVMLGFVIASGVGLALAGYYAARLAFGFRRFAPVVAVLCVVAGLLLAARPVRTLLRAPDAADGAAGAAEQTPDCCAGEDHP